MLKLRDRYHRRSLILCALIATAFIANRKVALLVSYALVIGGNSQVSHETFRPSGNEGAEAFPMGCKSLRVTADYSKLKLVFSPSFAGTSMGPIRSHRSWVAENILGHAQFEPQDRPSFDLSILRI
jgi:hypothetical protein